MKAQAEKLLVNAMHIPQLQQEARFSVCETCHKIIEGVCPDCLARALKAN